MNVHTCAGLSVSGTCRELGRFGRERQGEMAGGVSRVICDVLVTTAGLAADNIILQTKEL